MVRDLTIPEMNEAFGEKPVDLVTGTECISPVKVMILNKETSSEHYSYKKTDSILVSEVYIVPKIFIERVNTYFADRLKESGIEVDNKSNKEIHVSFVKMSQHGFERKNVRVGLKITIPEINYNKTFTGSEDSFLLSKASAYAIHRAIRQCMEDKKFQNYIKCLNDNPKD